MLIVRTTSLNLSTEQQKCQFKLHLQFMFLVVFSGWLLEFDILATPKVISRQVLTCDSAHSCKRYCASPLGDQATSIMT